MQGQDYQEIIRRNLTEDNWQDLKNALHNIVIHIACNKAIAGASPNYAGKVLTISNRVVKEVNKTDNPLYLVIIEQNEELVK